MDLTAVVDDARIRRLLAEYCHLVDDGRVGELAELFTVEGHFSFGRLAATGRNQVRDWFEENQSADLRGKHLTTNVVIDVLGDRAAALSDFVFLGFEGGRLLPQLAGRYRDELHRVDGRWLIHRREAIPCRPPRSL